MITPKENFVDRVEQSIRLFISNFYSYCLPIVVCNILFIVVIPAIVFQILPLEAVFSWDISQKFWLYISMLWILWGSYLMLYLIILIPIQVGIIKSIKDSLHESEINIQDNIFFGFKTIGNIFRTYWHIFTYVYMIPAGVFILWGLIFLGVEVSWAPWMWIIKIIWWTMMWVSVLVFLVFSIYRGLKSTFAVISAIDKEEYTKENLLSSVSLTKGKWWRIFWNLFAVGFIIWAVINLIKMIGSIFIAFSYDWNELLTTLSSQEDVDVSQVIQEFTEFQPIGFINSIIQTWVGSALGVIAIVFSYLLFKRLEIETWKKKIIKQKIIQEEL